MYDRNLNKDDIRLCWTINNAQRGRCNRDMTYCKECGNEIGIDSKFCGKCGKPILSNIDKDKDKNKNKIRCKNCDRDVDNDLEYCPHCGKSLYIKGYDDKRNKKHRRRDGEDDEDDEGGIFGGIGDIVGKIFG